MSERKEKHRPVGRVAKIMRNSIKTGPTVSLEKRRNTGMTTENKNTPTGVGVFQGELPKGNLTFSLGKAPVPILEFHVNGDIYIHGRLAANDLEVVEALREFVHGLREKEFQNKEWDCWEVNTKQGEDKDE